MSNNNLNDEDARLIARALKRNTNLKYLWLGDNDITEVGRSALCKAIYDPASLNSLSDCNQRCDIFGLRPGEFGGISFGNIPMNNDGYTLKQNRIRKIYYLLSVRNRDENNVHQFNLEFGDDDENDESLKLVPKVLECVQRYGQRESTDYVRESTDYVPALSVVYEVLRGWKMPELYEKPFFITNPRENTNMNQRNNNNTLQSMDVDEVNQKREEYAKINEKLNDACDMLEKNKEFIDKYSLSGLDNVTASYEQLITEIQSKKAELEIWFEGKGR